MSFSWLLVWAYRNKIKWSLFSKNEICSSSIKFYTQSNWRKEFKPNWNVCVQSLGFHWVPRRNLLMWRITKLVLSKMVPKRTSSYLGANLLKNDWFGTKISFWYRCIITAHSTFFKIRHSNSLTCTWTVFCKRFKP